MECEFATQCWSYLRCNLDLSNADDACAWLLDFLSSGSEEEITNIATGLWGIWHARNMRVWVNKILSPALAVDWSRRQVTEWREARRKHQTPQQSIAEDTRLPVKKWIAPGPGEFKLNVDASVRTEDHFFSIRMAIRDCKGTFVRGRTMKCAGSVSVLEAEAMGIREALSWLTTLPRMKLSIESDSLTSVNAVSKEMVYRNEVGHIFQECCVLLKALNRVSLHFVNRQANKIAHLMARVPCFLNCQNDFVSPPSLLLETIVAKALA